ncbi:MAG: vWA domain-containing protein [Planctomycetaceae bacterium]
MIGHLFAPFRDRRFVASLASSTLFNALLLLVFSIVTVGVAGMPEDLQFESLLSDETKDRDDPILVLKENDTVSKTLNTLPGGIVSATVETKSRPTKASQLTPVNDDFANVDVNAPSPTTEGIGREEFNIDIGEEEFKGEPTAIVDGYGDALNRITQELIRLMRKDKLLVVWLFDESESMRDDQKEIAENFHIVYKELRIIQTKLPKLGTKATKQQIGRANAKAPLLTAVYGFGDKLNKLLDPTADANAIIKTISEKIDIDETGKEHTCTAIVEAISRHKTFAARQRRKLVVIVVSDESGDDGMAVETTLKLAKRTKSPLYFLGRESMFGYPYARQRWIDRKYKLPHWIRINRGPETSFPECLQWDGLRARWDAFSSGFGPYEQVRLARETNGIFFVLPSEETNLVGAGARDKRQFAAHDMREYHPMWLSRTQYDRARRNSKFRRTIWDVIVRLNPTKHEENLIPRYDPQLNIRLWHYGLELPEFKKQAVVEARKAFRAWKTLHKALELLEEIKPLRATEPSSRWRANYDLALAQCLAFRVRLFQFLLAMDAHVLAKPPRTPKPPAPGRQPANEWVVARTRAMIEPDDAQFGRVKQTFQLKLTRQEFLDHLKSQQKRATELYIAVMGRHKGTPWARRAQWELARGFGMRFVGRYWSPRYRLVKKVPKF